MTGKLRGAGSPFHPKKAELVMSLVRVIGWDGLDKIAEHYAGMGENGLKMIPLLNRGSDSLRDMMDEAERLGLVIDEKTAAGFRALSEDMTRLRGVMTGLQNIIASRLLPVIAPIVAGVTAWIVANRDLIATRIAEWVDRLPALFNAAKDAAEAWTTALSPVVGIVTRFVEWIGPLNAGIGLMAAVIGGKLLATLWPLIAALTGLGGTLARLAVVPVVMAFVQFFAAIKAGTGVMAAFNAVLWANPIGLVILAVAALAAAAYLIYQNWDGISAWFANLWEKVKVSFNDFVQFVSDVFVDTFNKGLDGLKLIGGRVAGYLETLWQPVEAAFSRFASWVSGAFSGALNGAIDGLENIGKSVVGYFETLWQPVEAAFERFSSWGWAVRLRAH